MRNTITFRDADGVPITGLSVELYEWQATAPYYSNKIGDFTDAGSGQYYIDIDSSMRGTILVNSVVQTAFTGILLDGNAGAAIFEGSITTEMLADGAVTPAKTTFAGDF